MKTGNLRLSVEVAAENLGRQWIGIDISLTACRVMAANLRKEGPAVIIAGVEKLMAAPLMASDLRASAALVLAALAAHGITIVNRVYHIDRGYEKIEEKLNPVGAKITRISV